jgi:hypothetical protein
VSQLWPLRPLRLYHRALRSCCFANCFDIEILTKTPERPKIGTQCARPEVFSACSVFVVSLIGVSVRIYELGGVTGQHIAAGNLTPLPYDIVSAKPPRSSGRKKALPSRVA